MVAPARTPIRTDRLRSLNRPREVKVAEEQRTAGSGQWVAEKPDSFSIPKVIWFDETLKTIDVIREMWEI